MNKRQEEISRKILDYLRKNPDAGDSLEGISEWWLQSECIEQSVDKVAGVLEQLIKEGVIKKQRGEGGRPFYRVKVGFILTRKIQL